ncbi:FxsA family protein [Antarcticirhabdus aurantiaca]|uniref:Membrane protein FxsA n=1 Tax=Antarcticirhabdus aurantiaca TaxID=2606717 RepID=A0ACD4NPD3_9HYPH|nr:FxsA family protein [Antarcticirhabdus aurantiaca]WAJ28657.1 membrane protein FxsA [Jeongeuplla avenae]
MSRAFIPFLFLLMPIAEIAGFILVGNAIGLWPTLGLILASAFLGALLLRQQGLGTLRRIQEETRAGGLPGRELVHGLMIAVAGFLLILPGFISDVVGLLLFLPPVRDLAWRLLKQRIVVVASSERGVWRGGMGAGPRPGFGREGAMRPRPDVVDLGAADFERRGDPASPWHANGHDPSKPLPAPGEDDPTPGPRTLH